MRPRVSACPERSRIATICGRCAMTLLSLIITLVIVGVLLWAINAVVPMQPQIKTLLNAAVVVIMVLWVLSGLLGTGILTQPVRLR